jgi:hypothetical protein
MNLQVAWRWLGGGLEWLRPQKKFRRRWRQISPRKGGGRGGRGKGKKKKKKKGKEKEKEKGKEKEKEKEKEMKKVKVKENRVHTKKQT